jgi:hypothetical protein
MSGRVTAKRDELQAQVFLCQQLQVREWIQVVLRRTDISEDLATSLQSGEVLCHLLNAVKDGMVPVVRTDSVRRLENIDNFLRGCRELGLADSTLFEAHDLLESRNFSKIVRALMGFVSHVRFHFLLRGHAIFSQRTFHCRLFVWFALIFPNCLRHRQRFRSRPSRSSGQLFSSDWQSHRHRRLLQRLFLRRPSPLSAQQHL